MNYTQKEIEEIKNFSIIDFLANSGIYPEKEDSHKAWYRSPLREEKTASFKVDKLRNMYYDFGTSKHGDILQLVRDWKHMNFVDAVKHLSNNKYDNLPKHQNKSSSFDCQKSNALEVIKIQELQNTALISYLAGRKIPYNIGKKYLKEVYYKIKDKSYFSLAFANSAKGYAIRNKYFKGNISPNSYSLVAGTNTESLIIFEGFIDFLSYLVYYSKEMPKYDTIILNSLSNLSRAEDLFQNYKNIYLFLDNDKQGIKAKDEISAKYNAFDFSHIYQKHKDFNDFLGK